MDEARRFLRHVLPGTAFMLQLVLIDAILANRLLLTKLLDADKESAILVVLGGFVAAGGVGFLPAQTYFCCVSWVRRLVPPLDHAGTVRSLPERRYRLPPRVADAASLDRPEFRRTRQAWVEISAWWYIRAGSCRDMKYAERRAQVLADLVHTCGALLLSAPVGFLVSLAVIWFKDPPDDANRWGLGPWWQSIACAVAWAILGLFHLRNYHDTRLRFMGFIDGIVAEHESPLHSCRSGSDADENGDRR